MPRRAGIARGDGRALAVGPLASGSGRSLQRALRRLARHPTPFVVTLAASISASVCDDASRAPAGLQRARRFSTLLYDGKLIDGVRLPLTLAILVALLLYLRSSTPSSALALTHRQQPARGPPRRFRASAISCFLCRLRLLAAFGSLMLTARTGSGEPISRQPLCSRASPRPSSAGSACRAASAASSRWSSDRSSSPCSRRR